MYLLTSYPYTEVELTWSHPLPGRWEPRARQLRGALAQLFSGDDRFHQHDSEGRALYRYPPILYRWSRGKALIAGWGDAAQLLPNLPWLDLELTLGQDPVDVDDALIRCHAAEIAYSPRLHSYRLLSPALLFNQENYRGFQGLDSDQKHRELDRLLTAQLLTALRNLGAELPGHLYATLIDPHPKRCHFKQQELLGLGGRLLCNLTLPPGFAFGHAVSHGYGWTVPYQETA